MGIYDDGALRDEQGDDVHGLVHQAATIAAEVQDEPLHPLLLQGVVCIADALAHPLGELGHQDIAVPVVEHVHVFDGRKRDALPRDGNLDDVTRLPGGAAAQLLHAEDDRRPGLAAHLVGALLAREAVGGFPVDGLDLVAAAEAGLGGRGAGIGFVDLHVAVHVGLVDDGADAAIGVGQHHPEVFLLFLRDIHGIGIQRFQHRVHAFPLDAADFQGVDIGAVQFLEDGVVEFDPLAQGETLGLGRCGDGNGEGGEGREEISRSFHMQSVPGTPSHKRRASGAKLRKNGVSLRR